MKRLLYFILVLFFSELNLFCQKVDPSTAKKVAIANFQKHNLTGNAEVSEIVPFGLNNDTLIYIVKFVKKGFVIVSSYYAAPPILGQCYTDEFDTSKMPPGLLYLLEKYKYEISKIKENKLKPTKEVESKWNKILSGEYNSTKSYTIESILVPTKWNRWDIYQDEDHPVFCTGVAMAQILYYYKCRVTGPSTYYWNNMDLYSSDAENGLLIYDCSKECESSIFSGSSTPGLARDALVDHFGINSSADVKWRIWHLSNWEEMLKDEIDLERPILYSGAALLGGGHSWVIDGYNEDDEFSCNWGWGGDYDDFYSLGDFDPGGNGPFNQYESAIFNIVPIQSSGIGLPQLTAQSFTYSSNGYSLEIPDVFGATSYEWTTQYGNISGSSSTVTLYSDFTTNVQVRAYNNRCEIYSSNDSEAMTINYGPISGSRLLCSSGDNYTINNVPAGCTITWSSSDYITRISPQGSNPCTFSGMYSGGSGWITATLSSNCGSITLPQYTVWAGIPTDPTRIFNFISNGMEFGSSTYYTFTVNYPNNQPVNQYNWVVAGGTIIDGQGTESITVETGQATESANIYFNVDVRGGNDCGWGPYLYRSGYVIYGTGGAQSLSPNPASSEVTITVKNLESTALSNSIGDESVYTVSVFNMYGILQSQSKKSGSSFTIPVNNLKDGNYIVRITKGKKSSNLHLVVKH